MDLLSKNNTYKCIPFISMMYILLDIYHPLFINKLISMPFEVMTATAFLVCPMLDEVMTEVYYVKIFRLILLSEAIIKLIFYTVCYFLINLHSPNFWHGQNSYNLFFGHTPEMTIAISIAYLISTFANAHLLSKWKILLKGKYFWMRSVGSSVIGLAIFPMLAWPILLWFNGTFANAKIIISVMIWSFFIRASFIIIFSFPSIILVNILKVIDKPNIFEYPNFNPFKQNKVQQNSH